MRVFGVELFLTRGFYGTMPWNHRAVIEMGPQWHRLELASWSLEASWEPGRVGLYRIDAIRAAVATVFSVCTVVDWDLVL